MKLHTETKEEKEALDKINPVKVDCDYIKVKFDATWKAVKSYEEGYTLFVKRSDKCFIKVDSIQDVIRFISKLYISLSVEEERLKKC